MNVFIHSYMLSHGIILVRNSNSISKYIAIGVNISKLLIFSLIIIILQPSLDNLLYIRHYIKSNILFLFNQSKVLEIYFKCNLHHI